MKWLVTSLLLSVVLTVLLNLALRAFPGAGDRLARSLDKLATSETDTRRDGRRNRVIVPWKAMIVASVVLTIVLNVLIRVI